MKTRKYYRIEEMTKLANKYYEMKKMKLNEGDCWNPNFFYPIQGRRKY